LTLPAPVAGSYYDVVSGQCGPSVISQTVTLSPLPPTTLRVSSLVSQVCQGGSLTLSVSGSGPAPLAYAWRKDDPNGPILATGTSLTLTNAQPAEAGTYYVTLTSACTSQTVSVLVTVRYVRITTQPQSVNLCSGSTTLTVSVQAVGLTPTYQWRRNGTPISGATSASLTVQASRPGTYTVEVRASCGNVTSEAATVGCGNSRLSAEDPHLLVMPNPSSGQEIRCRVVGIDNPDFTLTTAAGRGVELTVRTGGKGEFWLTPKAALAPGVYALKATGGVRGLTQRVLVVK